MNNYPSVLMIAPEPESRGGISSVVSMYRDGGLFDHDVAFLASYKDGSTAGKIGHYLRFLAVYLWRLITVPTLQVVHVHSASRGSFARKSLVLLLAKCFGKRVILHIHGAEFTLFYSQSPRWLQPLLRWTLRRSDVIIALSQKWKADLFSICQHPDIRVIYNPTILRTPNPEVNEGPVRFLFMGRVGQRKGVYDILESARKLPENSVKIALYGDGEVETVREHVAAHGLHDRVEVHGWIAGEQKQEKFREADVLLLPSYHEGLPISILEAMAFGLPVVATDVGGIAEAVEDGVNGYLIAPGEVEALTDKMARLAGSPELRADMGRNSYTLACQKFALHIILEQLEALYDELGA